MIEASRPERNDKFVSQTATSIEVDNSQAKGEPIDFDDDGAEDDPDPE